jgi:hypothetical protein
LNRYFENSNSLGSIIERIEGALSLGHGINLGNNSLLLKIRHIEFVNYVLRNSVISYLRQSNANILTADYYSGQQFNAYESFGGILNCHLDFGTKLGFDQNYPRSADLLALRKKSISIRLSEENFETCNAQDLFGPIESALNTYIY